MRSIIFFSIVFTIITGLAFGARALIIHTNRKLWDWRLINRFARLLPYLILIFIAIAFTGGLLNIRYLLFSGMFLIAVSVVVSFILILSLPVSLLFIRAGDLLLCIKSNKPKADPESRRVFLKTAAAAIPVFTLTTAGSGFARAFNPVNIPQIKFTFPDLPVDLDGFRILHLSDLHLGYYYTLHDLENLLTKIADRHVDLVLVTGDVADDLKQLPDALRMIDQISTIHPKFVSLGNHEYYRGLDEVLRIIDNGPVPLLRDQGISLKIKNTSLFVGGADDPKIMHSNINWFMRRAIDKSMKDSSQGDFKVLMSHRPQALDVADEFGVNLILAGHTHGGQIGMNGRSVFEGVIKAQYMWGEYTKGATRLYTSSGVGHWFPYRLGCPAEAPIITLVKG